uniref:hypothetical protein n=1 Tax=Agathobacter sp. TaxID=2021311 RepID=UPI004056D1DF
MHCNHHSLASCRLHAYYHTVSSTTLNSVTVLLDENVAFQVYDAERNHKDLFACCRNIYLKRKFRMK